ncbi:MAG: thioredoxin family protein [Flavobacteriales bacterium]|jgi:hypothetical protein|nr:thioredoxin family protein [Flavobacteriales bacterium]MBT3963402.1 thioredoxin family protein [Flavobacteriales bacterium]MBT4704253.1 thioredoxin family protein [Flavobacteriales bacterium]MBT6132123.1 thioredoxin family protein [Flavobacteriales bacterium]MBT6979966.1 thioredoxin family protein [Flavobacteriales bacterium]
MDYKEIWESSLSYESLNDIFKQAVIDGKTTGHVQTQELVDFSKLNVQRMKRIGKTYVPSLNGIQNRKLQNDIVFLTMTESWCGDGAQAVPVIARIADELGIEHRYVLRDDNPELIDMHLTDGARSIPILMVLHRNNFELLGRWGSRPKAADQIMADWKELPEPKISKEDVKTQIQVWYNNDKQHSIQKEIVEVLDQV